MPDRSRRTARDTTTVDLRDMLLASWRTNHRTTAFLIERLPQPLWPRAVPGAPRRTIGMIAAHCHNARSRWIRTLGSEHGIVAPRLVDPRGTSPRDLLAALDRSSRGIEALLELGIANRGIVPPSKAYVWRNLPLDVAHVLTYFVAHEGHHRGQIVLAARALGERLPSEVTDGLWQWSQRVREAAGGATPAKRR